MLRCASALQHSTVSCACIPLPCTAQYKYLNRNTSVKFIGAEQFIVDYMILSYASASQHRQFPLCCMHLLINALMAQLPCWHVTFKSCWALSRCLLHPAELKGGTFSKVRWSQGGEPVLYAVVNVNAKGEGHIVQYEQVCFNLFTTVSCGDPP